MLLQPIVNYSLGGGWAITMGAPASTVKFKAASGKKLAVPLGGGVGKVLHIGKQHIKAQVVAYANAVHPTGAADTVLQTSFTFLFPK